MTPRRFKCSQFHKGNLDLNVECTKLLQNDFRKQRYITLNATIPGQDRIYPKTHLCRTFLLSIYFWSIWPLNMLTPHKMPNSKILFPYLNRFFLRDLPPDHEKNFRNASLQFVGVTFICRPVHWPQKDQPMSASFYFGKWDYLLPTFIILRGNQTCNKPSSYDTGSFGSSCVRRYLTSIHIICSITRLLRIFPFYKCRK